MAKIILFQGSGEIDPDNCVNYSIADLNADVKTIKIEGLSGAKFVNVVDRNYADDGWVNTGMQLSARNRSETPFEFGTFTVSGDVGDDTVIIYAQDGEAE